MQVSYLSVVNIHHCGWDESGAVDQCCSNWAVKRKTKVLPWRNSMVLSAQLLSLEQMGLQGRGLTNAPTVWPNGLCKDSPTELLLHQGHWTTGFSWSYSAAQGTFCQLPTPGWADLSKYRHLECEILTHASTETYTNLKTVVIPFIYTDR